LRDLLTLLHRIALVQTVPEALDPSWGHAERLTTLAQRLTPEDVQLYYQIGLLGQRDLNLAPDPRSGFEMTLLRMLAFRPDIGEDGPSGGTRVRPAKNEAATKRPESRSTASASSPPKPKADRAPAGQAESSPKLPETARITAESTGTPALDLDDWHATLESLGLGGMAAQLASHCSVAAWDGKRLLLHLDPAFQNLIGSKAERTLAQALRRQAGDRLELKIEARAPQGETPAQRAERDREQRQAGAIDALRRDPVVEALTERFEAELLEESVRPTDS
jgi:DNA polymerase-3 subunit gamma/tau